MNAERLSQLANVAIIILLLGTVAVSAVQATQRTTAEPETPVVVGVQGPGNNGQVVQVEPNGTYSWHRGDAASYHDITQLNQTHVVAAHVVDSERCGDYDSPCGRTGFRIFNRSSGEIVREWEYPVRTVANSEVHDAEPLPNGDVLVAGMDRERVFIVNQTGDIVWQWNASQHYEAPADPTKTDWLHINDADRIGEGRYLVSIRNMHQVLIIERGEGVVETINEHGDPTVIDSQHNPQWLGPGRVLISDSENNRVVELERQNGSWTPVWAVGGAGGMAFSWPRDADRLPNGNTLITDSRNHRVVIVDENGQLVAQWDTPKLPYDAELAGQRESSKAPAATGDGGIAGTQKAGVAIFRQAVVGLHHAVGAPAWLRWYHIGALCLAVVIRLAADVNSHVNPVEEA